MDLMEKFDGIFKVFEKINNKDKIIRGIIFLKTVPLEKPEPFPGLFTAELKGLRRDFKSNKLCSSIHSIPKLFQDASSPAPDFTYSCWPYLVPF